MIGKVVVVEDEAAGLSLARKILYQTVDRNTVLFLSGGKTPKPLYETLAKEGKLKPKAVGMVDERLDRSNLEMIKGTGLLNHFKNLGVNFYPIISDAAAYDKYIHSLFASCKNKVAIMGIGEDGHTAGLPASPKLQRGEPPGISNFQFPRPTSPASELAGGRAISNNEDLVIYINNFPGEFKERITLTFRALSEMDLLIVLAFGSAKQNALTSMFKEGSLEEIPARFYTKPEIAKKTILITDQKV